MMCSIILDIMFVNDASDWHLTASSPAVDAGVSTGAPLFDLDGVMRFDEVDSGAYEYDKSSSIGKVPVADGIFSLSPNPAVDRVNIQLEND